MPIYRTAASRTGAALAAAALSLATCSPGQAAARTGWRVVFSAHYGSPSSFNDLLSVTALSTTNAWAVGGTEDSGSLPDAAPIADHWDGTTWQAATLPSGVTGTLVAVSAPTGNDVWAVSDVTGYALHWNGTTWSVAKHWPEPPSPRELTGVTAFGPANVWVWGAQLANAGLGTWHFSGGKWQQVTTGPGAGVYTASALSPASIWGIGSDGTAPNDILVYYNGTTWQQITSPALSGLSFSAMLALSAGDVWVIASPASGPPTELLHFDGQQWTSVPVTAPPSTLLRTLTPDGHGGLWISGFNTADGSSWALHRSAAGTWSSRKLTGPGGGVNGFGLVPGTTSLWGAGYLVTRTGGDTAIWGRGPAT